MSSQQKRGGWGSLLSGAVAGLESRLDTILADDDQASAKSRAADAAAKQETGDKATAEKNKLKVDQASRPSSASRPNSRLQDRLARAVNKGGDSPRASSEIPSRPESPAVRATIISSDVARSSIDSKRSESILDNTAVVKEEEAKVEEYKTETDNAESLPSGVIPLASPPLPSTSPAISEQPAPTEMPTMSIPSIITPQPSSSRQSIDSIPSRPSIDVSTPADLDALVPSSPSANGIDLATLQKTHDEAVREHREEVHSHLERIDALQSKLSYLSQQLAVSAKSTSTDPESSSTEKKLAEKDAHIVALMEEGQKLSKTEMKHLTTIKKLRVKSQETDREIAALKQRLAKAERTISEQTERAKRAEVAEKAAQEKLKIVSKIEKDIELIRSEREEAGLTITELRRQLNDALTKAENAEKRIQAGALEAEKRAAASLKEDIENLKIEKKLAEDRWKRELQDSKEDASKQKEKANVLELELRGEIANLETKLELLRSRSEEVSSSATGDSQATLLRQIETLQTQYALASENWQGIESTLTSRVVALEKDRDETAKRESDIRRKARDVNSKARRLEDELESTNDRARILEQDLAEYKSSAQKLQARIAQTETAAQDARADLERERKVWESDLQQRIEEEKSKWRLELQSNSLSQDQLLRADSPSASHRRHSPDPLGILNRRPTPRSISTDLPLSPGLFDERRPSSSRTRSNQVRTPELGIPHRQDSIPSSLSNLNGASASNTPSIHTFDHDEAFENMSSPHRTINDMISVSTVGAGPSVQLVERMSAAVRRLESEKATSKEEMARLISQRDEAREEVVALMREIEEKRAQDQKVEKLESELQKMNERYETTLEMLGEKSEQVDELQGDVADLKKIYRDLVSTMK